MLPCTDACTMLISHAEAMQLIWLSADVANDVQEQNSPSSFHTLVMTLYLLPRGVLCR